MFFERNHVQIAIDAVGGATKTSNALGVANATVYTWLKARRVPDIDLAKRLSQLSGVAVERLRPV